jgi:diguanylate cyclase (GGDEF)-like protein
VLSRVVAVSGLLDDWVGGETDGFGDALDALADLLGLDAIRAGDVVTELSEALPELAPLLDADTPPADQLAEMAAEAILVRELMHHGDVERLQGDLADLTNVTRELEIASSTDPLTGLLNRRRFDEHLTRLCDAAAVAGGPLSVLFIDLDDFKQINDELGHHAGDEALRAVADRVTAQLRRIDVVARWGGDEIVAALPGTALPAAEAIAGRLVACFERLPIPVGDDREIVQGLTIGLAEFGTPATSDPTSLMEAADHALLDAKRAGKRRWHSARRTQAAPVRS